MKIMHIALLSALGSFLLPGCHTPEKTASKPATPAERVVSQADFERLKALSGDWYLVSGVRLDVELEPNLEEPFLSYSVSSGGHSVVEKLFAGKPNEMTSVYYLDSGRLMMDHYCSLGNQPRMVAFSHAGDEIDFELIGVTNMNDEDELHISSHALEFHGPNELTARWGATKAGVPGGGSRYTVKRLDSGN